jgi:hypothetical protein
MYLCPLLVTRKLKDHLKEGSRNFLFYFSFFWRELRKDTPSKNLRDKFLYCSIDTYTVLDLKADFSTPMVLDVMRDYFQSWIIFFI